MKISNNYNLKSLNTFGINSICKGYIEIYSEGDIVEYFTDYNKNNNFLILSGGSNILLPDYYNGDIIHIKIKGISENQITYNQSIFKVAAGENWHSFVEKIVEKGFIGLENMALIPGNVGTAPIQNIGAYGVEQDEHFESLEGYNINTKRFETYSKEECEFGYRNSIFKNKLKGTFIITSVKYNLSKNKEHNLSYRELNNYLSDNKLEINSKNIFDSVIKIRQSKLPDPNILGNSGSFFKNPIIPKLKFTELKEKYDDLKGFEHNDGNIKISAGWLIEKAGLKGYRVGDAAVYDSHALILVNHGIATSKDIIDVAYHVIEKVDMLFGIKLVPEVNII
jgi:UDP-N-acetylmuramate dehydrogenase